MRIASTASNAGVRAWRTERECCGFPQSRPNPRGGSTLSSSARSRVHISSSLCASTDSPETVGQVVEPRLVLRLKVEQGADRILPALRSGSAVLRWSVMLLRLRCLAALTITPLPLCVGQSHGHCAPLRNGADGAAAV